MSYNDGIAALNLEMPVSVKLQTGMDNGKKCLGYFMAISNHKLSNTPVDNALYYNDMYNKLSLR